MTRTRDYLGGSWGPWVMRYKADARTARAGARLEVRAYGQVDLSGHLGRHGLHLGYMPRRKQAERGRRALRVLNASHRVGDAQRAVAEAAASDLSVRDPLARALAAARLDQLHVQRDVALEEQRLARPRLLLQVPRKVPAPA